MEMPFDPNIALIRFGYGLAPKQSSVTDIGALIAEVQGPDLMAEKFPIEPMGIYLNRLKYFRALGKMRKSGKTEEVEKGLKTLRRRARVDQVTWFGQSLLRCANAPIGFRERLVAFWADHFTTVGKGGLFKWAVPPHIETSIRPHVAGRFADLLIAATTSPMMLVYLDQNRSIGPNSVRGKKVPYRGLNENLARELLELHTLGVGGPYEQKDVRQLAQLLTGLTTDEEAGTIFDARLAEPGAEVILGKTYGSDQPRIEDIHAVLTDLARHPATALNIAKKLAIHFVSDDPPTPLIMEMVNAYLSSDGDLSAVYTTLLNHNAAWRSQRFNAKPPFDFIASSLRALGIGTSWSTGVDMSRHLLGPLTLMGQTWAAPNGPNGWPEEDSAWITPQGLASRMQWAMAVPQLLRPDLPDPRDFVQTALGGTASEKLRFVAAAAESRTEGIGLILTSPEFQRR